MKLELIRDEAGLQALQPFWDNLLEQSATPTPFLRWDWVSFWWAEHRNDYRLAVGVIRDEAGEPEAIAPLVVGKEPEGPRRHLRQLSFINGIGPLQGERLDFLVQRGREEVLMPVLCGIFAQLGGEWDVVRLNKMPEESPNYPFVQKALSACGRDAGVLNRTECLYIQLPKTWEEYEARHSSRWRSKMRRRCQNLKEEIGGQFRLGGRDFPAAQAFDEFAKLHAMNWPEGVSSFLRGPSLRLHRELALRWLPTGQMILPCIEKEGRLIASIYGLKCGNEVLQYQLGWNPAYAKISLGVIAMRWAVEHAILAGYQHYDLLPGDHEYKRSWCDTARYVADPECFHRLRPRAVVFQLLRSLKRRVAKPAVAPIKPETVDCS
jgi:CelD/BcsL family acetyltransferase involved in cellulose biosynthesis